MMNQGHGKGAHFLLIDGCGKNLSLKAIKLKGECDNNELGADLL